MMNAIVPAANGGSSALIPTSMEGAMRLAEMMARGKLVPNHLQNAPGDCLMVIEQSMRWGMSPFAVAQSTSVIQGKLMFEGKLVSAALHGSGLLASRMNYEFTGEGQGRAVEASATIKGEDKPRTIRIALAEAKTTNGMWTKQPDQQLVYFATRAWARRHAPEVMLGVYSPEEFDQQPSRDSFTGTTIEADGQPRDTIRAIGDEIPARVMDAAPATPPRQTVKEWLAETRADLEAAATSDAVDAIVARDKVQQGLDRLTNGALTALKEMIRVAQARTQPIENDPFPGDMPSGPDAA